MAELNAMQPDFRAAWPLSEENEITAYPWWAIVRKAGLGMLAVLAGPFASRESAEAQRMARIHAYGEKSSVFCFSGHESADYRKLCGAMQAKWLPKEERKDAGAASGLGQCAVDVNRLDWWERNLNYEHGVDYETGEVVIYRVTGSINDRVWHEVSRAATLRGAIDGILAVSAAKEVRP